MLLRVEKLSKQYLHKDGTIDALKDITFNVKKGSFVTIAGPSGSGKTTLLLALSGLMRPTSGHISFNDQALEIASDNKLAHFRKNHVGFVMQNFSLIPYLTAIRNVMIPLALQNIDYTIQLSLATNVMELVGLKDRINHLPRELSSGQQQRVAIARALVNKPSVIFADEPTGNLDPLLSIEILEFLKNINKTKSITIIMVSHSPVAVEYGDVKIKLEDGHIV